MALLQTVYQIVVKQGVIPKLVKLLPVLSLLLAFGGLGWLFVLPMDGQYRNTYISENALMPSQAYSYFRESEWNVMRGFRTQINGFEPMEVRDNMEMMKSWLEDIGYKAAIHRGANGERNLYAIFHAPRGDDTEAMVLGAGYFNSEGEFNIGGMSLTLALARYFHRWIVWSKNIIIVIPQDPNDSLRSWVNAYHNSLDLTGGSIESAVMLDYASASDNFEFVEVYYEGLNGQLPNLDLINTVVSVTEHEGPNVGIQGMERDYLETNNYWTRLRILFRGIVELSTAGLKKGHGNEAFSGYRIQAVTLKAKNFDGPYDVTVFGRIPEAIFRSVNNLLEKFHQSFFFYLLLSPQNFVSIGTYLPSACALVFSYILASLHKLLNSGFEIRHLGQFGGHCALIFGSCLAIGFVISQLAPFLPVHMNFELVMASAVGSFTPLLTQIELPRENKTVLRSFALLYFSTVLSSLQVLNFSLTFTIGFFALPLTFINDSSSTLVNCLWLLVSNPFTLSPLISLDFEGGLLELFTGLLTSWKLLDCHTWIVVTVGWLPAWLMMLYSVIIVDPSRGATDPKKAE